MFQSNFQENYKQHSGYELVQKTQSFPHECPLPSNPTEILSKAQKKLEKIKRKEILNKSQ